MRYPTTVAALAITLAIGTGTLVAGGGHGTDLESRGGPVAAVSDDRVPRATTTTTAATTSTTADIDEGVGPDVDPGTSPEASKGAQATVAADASGSVHEVLVGGSTVDPDDAGSDPIGQFDTTGLAPDGIDLTSIPGVPDELEFQPAFDGPDDFAVAPSCQTRCITSGTAYPRGFGVDVAIKTSLPTKLVVWVALDADDNGTFEYSQTFKSGGFTTEFGFVLDHLAPGEDYYAVVSATDEHGWSRNTWGEFTTLSTRTVHVSVDRAEVIGGPTNIERASQFLSLTGSPPAVFEMGESVTFVSPTRLTEAALRVHRGWPAADPCEVLGPDSWALDHGDSDSSCETWNTARAIVDLDRIPAGRSRWTTLQFSVAAAPLSAGGALPPGYGNPRHFDLRADLRFHVVYS